MSSRQQQLPDSLLARTFEPSSLPPKISPPPQMEASDPGRYAHFHSELFRDPASQVSYLLNLLHRKGCNDITRDTIITGDKYYRGAGKAPKMDHSTRAVPVLQMTSADPEESFIFAATLLELSLALNEMRLYGAHTPFDDIHLMPEVTFVPDAFRWVWIDPCGNQLGKHGGEVHLDTLYKTNELPDLAVLFAAVLFPQWLNAWGTETAGEFIPTPIMRAFQRVLQPGSEMFETVDCVSFRRNKGRILITEHQVTHCPVNWHYCVPTIWPPAAHAAPAMH